MRFHSRMATVAALLAALSFALPSAADSPAIRIDGSSTVYPITNAVAEAFVKRKQNAVRVSVDISGTGGGFRKFCRGEIDIADASRPIVATEIDACKAAGIDFIELPVAFDALTVVINPRNTFLKSITVAELKKMWEPASQNRIRTWQQINPDWPDVPFKLFGPGADSGTFDYFTEAVVGKARASRTDYVPSEDDQVLVRGVMHDANALGYFGYSYYVENMNRLKAVPIAEKPGMPGVLPSLDSVMAGTYRPLSRPMFIYVSTKSISRPEVEEFVYYYLQNAAALVKVARSVPLPRAAYVQAADNFKRRKTGTIFGGAAETGLTVEELLRRENKQ